jgi:ABC-2 type transport system ATP-binding protein
MNIVETSGLGKRYGSTWALRDCSLAIPAGHAAALVGSNGAGKTTLLNLAVGLAEPTAGAVTVLGGLAAGSRAALDGITFVAQDTPVYRNLSAADMLHLTRNLNRRFDQPYAKARLGELGIPLNRKAGKLSGGQRAQLALTVALGRRPRLLVLDEPVAMLDPVARHDFMASGMTAMAPRACRWCCPRTCSPTWSPPELEFATGRWRVSARQGTTPGPETRDDFKTAVERPPTCWPGRLYARRLYPPE